MRCFLLIGLVACAGAEKTPAQTAGAEALGWPVDEPGPLGVGYRTWEISYQPSAASEERIIRLNLWYPTEDTEGDPAQYTFGGEDEAVFQGASLAASVHHGAYPVHVHSHGYRGFGASSVFLARYLASHGWMTLAPDHTNNTIMDHEDPLPAAHFFHRPLDVAAALDAMGADPVGREADTEAVLLSGHSFGGYTTWAAGGARYDLENIASMCATGEGLEDDGCTEEEEAMFATDLSDPRVVATLPLAGSYRNAFFGDTGYQAVNGPVLFMSGTHDEVGQAAQYEQMQGIDFTWAELDGGCHQSFALGACSTLDPDLGFHIVQTIALSFARATVLSDQSAAVQGVLSGEIEVAEEVTLKRRENG